ncbi:hypothetical protein ABEB36_012650 [Hypothenemus hampei]|uniref:Odorant receptor n=1 Tax=Hypothenemus hampei TaxID=57062 RepID=A0ABD1EC38_HYPHA
MGLLAISTFFYQLIGIWPIENNKSKLKHIFYRIYGNFLVIWVVVFNVFLALGFIKLIIKKESFGRLSNSLSILLTQLLMIVNITIFNQKKVAYLCQDIKIYEKNHLLNPRDPEISVIYEAILKKCKILNVFTLVTTYGTILLFIVVPLLLLYKTGPNFWKSDAPFMFELYVPFDRQNYYWFLIIANIVTAWLNAVIYITGQTTFYSLFMYGTLRFQILQLKIDKLSTCDEENLFATLKNLIIEHHNTINFIDILNEKISYAVMSTFMVNSIKLGSGVIGFMIDIKDLPFSMIYLTLMLADVYFLGWTCNGIQDQSFRVAERIYAIQWNNKGKAFKFMVQMMMMRAQRPTNIKIGPLGVMNMDTILSTLKTAYSVTTFLLKMR